MRDAERGTPCGGAGAPAPPGSSGAAGECVLSTMLGAAIVGTPFLGVGVIVSWCAVFGWGEYRPVDLFVSTALCVLGAMALFCPSCMGRRGGAGRTGYPIGTPGGRLWIVAAGVSGGVVLPCAIAWHFLPAGALPGVQWWGILPAGWGILVVVTLGKCATGGAGRGRRVLAGAWRIAMGVGRTGAAALVMDGIDELGCRRLPRLTPEGWGPAVWGLGLAGVLLMDELGFLPLHRLRGGGCGNGKSGCVLHQGASPGVTTNRDAHHS